MKLFGPPLKEVWAELANQIGGEFIPGKIVRSSRVVKKYGNFEILLDTYIVGTGKGTMTFTRMRVPFVRENEIQFKLSKKNIFSGIGSLFGMPVVSSYDYDFDDKYIIKGNDENVIREIFQNDELKERIIFQKSLILKVSPYKQKKSPDSSEIYFQVTGVLKDIEKLRNLFDLFVLLLDEFVDKGVASTEASSVRLK